MKKFLPLLLLLISSIFIFSCKDDDDDYVEVNVDYPTVYDLNLNLKNDPNSGWSYGQSFNKPLLDQDYVMIYRRAGTDNNAPVWQQIPRTLYPFDNNPALELDYDFDFTRNDFMIYAGGNYDISTTPEFLNNQTFRIILVPAEFGGKSSVDPRKLSYEEVIRLYKIDDSKVGKL